MTVLAAPHPGEAAPTTSAPLAVIVTKADGGVTRIGPITAPGEARAIHASLTRATTIPEKASASAEIARFNSAEPHLPLLDAEVETVLELMDDTEQGVEAPFPNLWDRLVAQHGLTVADTLIRAALAARRQGHRPSADGAAPRPSRSRADDRFEHALREVLLENAGPGGMSPAALNHTLTSIRHLAEAWARSRPLHPPGS
ncbi:hypothetical protein [Streptomyces violascens]|uniref:hypothetical protein n=1 Tax=Streptomyces violascens TaxID=67381 RepID=UPI00167232F4|nr:hypothetical protein [Streptomyces violascens]GGU40644.1 hypothetical protein GCM10010289_71980 [Streptomyces violascens]